MTSRHLRIATRQSPLALWQAEHIAQRLSLIGVSTQIVPLISSGDIDMRPIMAGRQMGVFTKRIQQALIDDEADVAVHSLKDLPTEVDKTLVLAAVPQRETVVDALVSPDQWTLDDLPQRARVGTGSRRRVAQLLFLRPDLQLSPIRGNVQTRLAKLTAGEFDAIVLAEAGILRLGMDELPRVALSLNDMLPAPGQGALGIEVRRDDAEAERLVSQLSDPATFACVTAERTLLSALHGGCLAPIAALAEVANNQLRLTARVLSTNGVTRLHEEAESSIDLTNWLHTAEKLGTQLSEMLAAQGAHQLVEAGRDANA